VLLATGYIAAGPLPTVIVQASYPGASAAVVADTVAAPVELQVGGVEKMRYMRSRCTNDGKYTLAVAFEPGTDLDKARALVRQRVRLAAPVLPDIMPRTGITVRDKSPGAPVIVGLSSTDGAYDTLYLGNYADINIKDELARLPGVAGVRLVGHGNYSMRVWLDPDKLAAYNVTAGDVVRALREQKTEATSDRPDKPKVGKPEVISVKPLGGLTELAQLDDIIVKTDGPGHLVRLRDVARVEMGVDSRRSEASFNGQPGVFLCVYPSRQARPKQLTASVQEVLGQLRRRLPRGLALGIRFDFSSDREAPGYLLVDLTLPDSASPERAAHVLRKCADLVGRTAGVRDVLALSEDPFGLFADRPCVLVTLGPGRDRSVQAIRTRLEEGIPDAQVRLCESLSGYPIDLAVHGPDGHKVRQLAATLAERLYDSKRLTDVAADRASMPRPQLYVDIDRTKAKSMGVALTDVFDVLQASLGGYYVNDFNRFGRTWQVVVQLGDRWRAQVEDLKQLKVRNKRGDMVPLGTLAAIRHIEGSTALDRLDGRPMVEVTANPATGVSPREARKLCEELLAQVRKEQRLPDEYRVTWLR
jgi:multidrug efflux pump subunit AcrB